MVALTDTYGDCSLILALTCYADARLDRRYRGWVLDKAYEYIVLSLGLGLMLLVFDELVTGVGKSAID